MPILYEYSNLSLSMNSKSAALTKKLQYQRWAEEVKACENHPVGMSVARWCRENGIKQPTYYDHLHKVKELCLDIYENNNYSPVETEIVSVNNPSDVSNIKAPSFIELPLPTMNVESKPAVTINLGKSQIVVSENISDSFLRRLLKVLSNA